MVGSAAPYGRSQLNQEGPFGKTAERGKTWAGGEEKEWTDYVSKNHWVFGITGDWNTVALDPGACILRRLQAYGRMSEQRRNGTQKPAQNKRGRKDK